MYPPILSLNLGIPLSLVLNFGAPILAWLLARKLRGYRWWPHAIACFWEIISTVVFSTLLLPVYVDETPGPGEGFALFPTLFSAVAVLLGYCLMLIYKFVRWRT
jgi:hypothetical protein